MKILIGTNNQNKLAQYGRALKKMLPDAEALALSDLGITLDVEEDGDSLMHNAKKKAQEYAELSGMLAVADDTGLFIDALGGEPGLHAKRWTAGSDKDRCLKILERLMGVSGDLRSARYEAVVACYDPEKKEFYISQTTVEGLISEKYEGENGFGYDPIFFVEKFGKKFAQLNTDEIDSISHRTTGMQEIINKLKNR